MNEVPKVRPACQSDSDLLSALAVETYVAAFGPSFSDPADLTAHLKAHLAPESFARILVEDSVLLAEVETRLVGYVQFGAAKTLSARSEDRELRRLYVHPSFQNRGIGSALMEAALHHSRLRGAATIYLDVWERNHAAQRFYQRYGFEIIGAHNFAVASGAATDSDLIMVRHVLR